jgi:hypothetical protein
MCILGAVSRSRSLTSRNIASSSMVVSKPVNSYNHEPGAIDKGQSTLAELKGKLALVNMIKARLKAAALKERQNKKEAEEKEFGIQDNDRPESKGYRRFLQRKLEKLRAERLAHPFVLNACVPSMTKLCGDKYDKETCQSCVATEFSNRFPNEPLDAKHIVRLHNLKPKAKCWLHNLKTLCKQIFQGPTATPSAAPSASPTTPPTTHSPTASPTINGVLSCQAALTKRCPQAYDPAKCLQCVSLIPPFGLEVLGGDTGRSRSEMHGAGGESLEAISDGMHCSRSGLRKLCGRASDSSNTFREFFATPGFCERSSAARCLQLATAGSASGSFSVDVCTHCMGR